MTSRTLLALLGAAFLTTAATAAVSHGVWHGQGAEAIGQAGQAAKVNRTVQIDLADIKGAIKVGSVSK